MASVLKTVLALRGRELPPSLHFETPNPRIDFASSPFFVQTRLEPWTGPAPLRAGVTALGAGGTNAHLVLEEAPPRPEAESRRPAQLLCVSARTDEAAAASCANLAAHLASHPGTSLAEVAYTLQVGRKPFASGAPPWRGRGRRRPSRSWARILPAAFGRDSGAAVCRLHVPGRRRAARRMARELYDVEPVFRAEVDRCLAFLAPLLDLDILPALLGATTSSSGPASRSRRSSRWSSRSRAS